MVVAACVILISSLNSTYLGGVDGEKEGQVAIIARKNSTLFDEMVTVCTDLDESSKIIGFAGVCLMHPVCHLCRPA